MKRMIIAAVVMGLVSIVVLSSQTNTFDAPDASNTIKILGHIEYVLRDGNGNIKAYSQTDNVVTDEGYKCIADHMFGATVDPPCPDGIFNVIAISNASKTIDKGLKMSDENAADGTMLGIVATKKATVEILNPTESMIKLNITTIEPFAFSNNNSPNAINATYLTNAECTPTGMDVCTAKPSGHILAAQTTNTLTGILTGDTIDVTWIITMGNAN